MDESNSDLTELIKRRLESVASTGSSASSGFIEDKSYSDSEDDEEGKRTLPDPKSFIGKISVTWLCHTHCHTLYKPLHVLACS